MIDSRIFTAPVSPKPCPTLPAREWWETDSEYESRIGKADHALEVTIDLLPVIANYRVEVYIESRITGQWTMFKRDEFSSGMNPSKYFIC